MRGNKKDQIENNVKSDIRWLFRRALAEAMPLSEILDNRTIIFSDERVKALPRYMRYGLSQYFDAYLEIHQSENTVFLYDFEGQLYRLSKNPELDLPCWDVLLPSFRDNAERYQAFGLSGGTYYRNNFSKYF